MNLVKKIIRFICTIVAKGQLKGRCGERLIVNFPCKFTKTTCVGKYCNFNGMKISGEGTVSIGNYFHSGKHIRIITSNHNYEGTMIPYDDTMLSKNVVIGDCVWVGEGVTILSGITIGEGAIIQAGSIVCKDIPPYAIAGGHPAIPFAHRNSDHFEELKRKGKFF